jgi:hypothetical protein
MTNNIVTTPFIALTPDRWFKMCWIWDKGRLIYNEFILFWNPGYFSTPSSPLSGPGMATDKAYSNGEREGESLARP